MLDILGKIIGVSKYYLHLTPQKNMFIFFSGFQCMERRQREKGLANLIIKLGLDFVVTLDLFHLWLVWGAEWNHQ